MPPLLMASHSASSMRGLLYFAGVSYHSKETEDAATPKFPRIKKFTNFVYKKQILYLFESVLAFLAELQFQLVEAGYFLG